MSRETLYQAWQHGSSKEQRVKQPMKTSQPSECSQSESSVDDRESPAVLNMYLDNYLHTLGYCARRKHLHRL